MQAIHSSCRGWKDVILSQGPELSVQLPGDQIQKPTFLHECGHLLRCHPWGHRHRHRLCATVFMDWAESRPCAGGFGWNLSGFCRGWKRICRGLEGFFCRLDGLLGQDLCPREIPGLCKRIQPEISASSHKISYALRVQ